MPDFTLKNLMDVEDSAEGRMPDGLEARFGRSHIGSEHLGVSLFRFGPDFKTPIGHRHREQEEAYVVLAGSGEAKLDDETVAVSQWDVLRVAPSVGRAFRAGPDGLQLLAIGNDRPEGGDGEMIENFWPD